MAVTAVSFGSPLEDEARPAQKNSSFELTGGIYDLLPTPINDPFGENVTPNCALSDGVFMAWDATSKKWDAAADGERALRMAMTLGTYKVAIRESGAPVGVDRSGSVSGLIGTAFITIDATKTIEGALTDYTVDTPVGVSKGKLIANPGAGERVLGKVTTVLSTTNVAIQIKVD